MKCHAVLCSKYFIVKREQCQIMLTHWNVVFKIFLKLTPVLPTKYGSFSSLEILENIEKVVQKTGGVIGTMTMSCSIYNKTEGVLTDTFINNCFLDLYVQSLEEQYVDVIPTEMKKLHRSYITTNNVWISQENGETKSLKVEVLSKSGLNTSNNNIVFNISFPSNSSTSFDTQEPPIFVDIVSPLSCPFVNISGNEIAKESINEDQLVLDGNFVIKQNQWYSDDGFFFICADEYRRYQNYTTENTNDLIDPEVIVSTVCSALSIFALLLIVSTYLVHSNLRRTLPGKNLVSLSGSLMVAQILYLIANFAGLQSSTYSCKVAGLLLHFFLLVAVFWMNVCTFHMFRVLTRTRTLSASSGWKRFAMYLLYIVGCSMICVGINVLASSQYYGHIGYGQHTCYISSQVLLYFTFGLPLAYVIVSNLGMFLAVIVKIKRTGSVTRNVQNQRNDLFVFAKLSTITGATWIFGFMYAWTNIVVFSYIFIVLNASQGLLLCFAFLANKRVLIMYKELSTRSRRGLDSSSRSQPTTTDTCRE